ncbi:MAG: hypothetical protein AAF573_12665 [Bacteroidota bacterium]
MHFNNSKVWNRIGTFIIICLFGIQSSNAQSLKKDDRTTSSPQKVEDQQITPGERHPEDVKMDQKMAAQGISATKSSSTAINAERDPEDVAIDRKMAADGISATKSNIAPFNAERDPEDVAIDQKMGLQNNQPDSKKVDEGLNGDFGDLTVPETNTANAVRHDGSDNFEPQPRGTDNGVDAVRPPMNPDGSVVGSEPAEPTPSKKVSSATQSQKEVKLPMNRDGSVKKTEN